MSELGPRWYVVRTHPQAEAKALYNLMRQELTAYLPRYIKRRRHARRTDYVPVPLFPRYLFVALDLAASGWRQIRSTIGVADIVCNGAQPTPVPMGVVESIRAREDENGWVRLSLAHPFAKGAPVRIVDGAFADQIGLFDAAADAQRVAVLLDLLGRQVRVLLPEGYVAHAA